MKNINLIELNLNELTSNEVENINGGDDFLHDLGYAIGYWWGSIDWSNFGNPTYAEIHGKV